VLGIDPGPSKHGWALLDFSTPNAPVWFLGGACEEIEGVFDGLDASGTRPALVAIEQPRALHNPMANGPVIATAWAGGIVVGLARSRGFEVVEVGQNEWRLALVGHSRAGDNVDHKVEAHLRRFVRQFPTRSSTHARDAAGVACVAYRAARMHGLGGIGGQRA